MALSVSPNHRQIFGQVWINDLVDAEPNIVATIVRKASADCGALLAVFRSPAAAIEQVEGHLIMGLEAVQRDIVPMATQ
jgi:hypothetical protein